MEELLSKNPKIKKEKDNGYLFDFDGKIKTEYGLFCGIDEAGRGPLAGDVYAAAVILPQGFIINGLDDSKKLSGKKRAELFGIITENALSYCIAAASAEEIDNLNILNATMLAMKRAYEGLKIKPDYALVDGNKTPELDIKCQAVVKGDAKSASIAAASVLAKTARDRYMEELAKIYPEYLFERHKGYPTKLHYEMLLKYGVSPVHRKSFLKNLYKGIK